MTATTGRVPRRPGRTSRLDSAARRLSPAERASRGKDARSAVPRDSHAACGPPAGAGVLRAGLALFGPVTSDPVIWRLVTRWLRLLPGTSDLAIGVAAAALREHGSATLVLRTG
jgi:hypothetical protein